MQSKYVLSKTYENEILMVTLQNYAKINFKRLHKNLKKTYKDFISTSLKIFKIIMALSSGYFSLLQVLIAKLIELFGFFK